VNWNPGPTCFEFLAAIITQGFSASRIALQKRGYIIACRYRELLFGGITDSVLTSGPLLGWLKAENAVLGRAPVVQDSLS
jgi:hypothetical protein